MVVRAYSQPFGHYCLGFRQGPERPHQACSAQQKGSSQMLMSTEHAYFTAAASESAIQLPSFDDLFCTLHQCCLKKTLPHAQLLHLHVCAIGLEAHHALGNHLVPLFVACGSLPIAQQVFNRLVYANEYSWTSLIQGYAESGELQHALNIHASMQDNAVQPNRHTFVALLKACTMSDCLESGRRLHINIIKEGFHYDLYVGNTLIDMYAKYGSVVESRDVLYELQLRDVVSWTALMAGYAEHGPSEETLQCLKKMQVEGVQPNSFTFVSALKACCTLGVIDKGLELHAEIIHKGFDGDLFVANTLVDLYANCGSIVEAQKVFNKLVNRDVVSWNALISGYAEQGLGEDALCCAQQMQFEGVSPVAVTFLCTLKVCGIKGVTDKGRELHSDVVKGGFERLQSVGNSLVDMYAKCGALPESREVFDKLQVREDVSWNTLIAGYAAHGLDKEALDCLEHMQMEGICPDAVTFVCILDVCGHRKAIDRGRKIHAEISKKGFEREPFVGNSLVDLYAKFGLVTESQKVFDKLLVREVVSWNALIAGYADNGLGEEALNCLKNMHMEGVSPDSVTFTCSLRACGRISCIERGQDIHMDLIRRAFERDPLVNSSLVDMYAKCGLLAEAQEMFDQLPIHNVVSWTALIAGYSDHGLCGVALSCFWQMQLEGVPPDVASWNAIISGYAEHGETKMVFKLYAQVQEQGLLPSSAMFISILKACGNMAALDVGKRIHAIIYRLEAAEVNLAPAFIDMYGKCGSMVDVQWVFDTMPSRDHLTWNALITAYAHQGDCEHVFHFLEKTKEEGVQPDGVTFLSVLSVCNHAGLVDKGKIYFDAMSKEYGIERTIKHYTCITDLLGRAGCLTEALASIKMMPFEPDYAVWCTVLGACRRWGNVKLGEQAFDCAVRLDKKHDAAYILMYNIYADAHMWDKAKELEAIILNMQALKGIRKQKTKTVSYENNAPSKPKELSSKLGLLV